MSLREELDNNAALNRTAETYDAGLETLRKGYHHTIQIVPSGDIDRFNCFAFATGIAELADYQEIVRIKGTSAFMDSAFFRELIADADLHPVEHASPGGIAVYFNGDTLTHAARILDNPSRLRSKWGPLEVHEHAHFEVPASYGDDLRFFTSPDRDAIIKRLLNEV